MTTDRYKHLSFAGVLFLLLFFLWESAILLSAAKEALSFTAQTILPALFPFLVLSGMLAKAARGIRLPGSALFRRLFRLPGEGFLAFLLGALCGFPIGVKVTAELYRAGAITREEAARLAALSANTGPGFTVAAIGGALFGSRGLGLRIYVIQMLSGVLLGVLAARRTPLPAARPQFDGDEKKEPFSELLYRASLSMLGIAGITVFFGTLASLGARLLPPLAAAGLTALLEVGNAARAAAALPETIGIPLVFFAVSFSGLSVLMQSAALLSPEGISMSPLLKRKLLQGLLAAAIALL